MDQPPAPEDPDVDPFATVVEGPDAGGPAADPYATAMPSAADWTTGQSVVAEPVGMPFRSPRAEGRRYRNLRPHAKGGLGAVFLAQDLELGREVALKEIKDHYADNPGHRARFLLEAEVTGCLEHPGIVPIYGLGQDRDGRPYYAMRFIDGENLGEAIRRHREAHGKKDADPGARALSIRKLLAHFVDVCEAIAYAHSRGVIHRDLKPDNVMLGGYGETLVVDWGLAKPMGCCFGHDEATATPVTPVSTFDAPLEATLVDTEPQADPGPAESRAPSRVPRPLVLSSHGLASETMAGSAIGTPAYMPPEQAQGDLDQLGPQSDIYSLGAMLYCVLTGQPPFIDRAVLTVLEKVTRGEFPSPIEVDPTVPRALDAIVRTAMALRPEDRYRSARALGDDVDRWLADEPVTAYREPWTDRLRRWARGHRSTVAAASVLLITAVVGLTIGTAMLERERARTDRERQVALRNYRLAYDAADKMLGEVAEVDLADIPQMEPVRRRLLETAETRFAELLDQRSGDPEVALLAGRTQARLGDVLALIGRPSKAEASYRRAINGLVGLVPRLPGDDRVDFELAHAQQGLGALLRRTNRLREAEPHLRDAIDRLSKLDPADREVRKRLADARYQLGALLARQTRRSPQQEEAYQQAIADQEALLVEGGHDPESVEKLARYRNNLAILEARSRPDLAERRLLDILSSIDKLDRPSRGLPGPRWQQGRAWNNLAALLMQQAARAGEADPKLESSRSILETLTAEFPRIPQYRRELAVIASNQGRRARRMDQPAEAAGRFREAIGLLETLAKDEPEIPDYQQLLAVARGDLAGLLARSDLKAAEVEFQSAIAIQEALNRAYPDVVEYRNALGRCHYDLGKVLVDRQDSARAVPAIERAIELHRASLDVHSSNDLFRSNLFEDQGLLMVAAFNLGDLERAAAMAEAGATTRPDERLAYLRGASVLTSCSVKAGQNADFADRAIRLLRLGFDKGVLTGVDTLALPEFAPLASRPGFDRLKQEVGASPGKQSP